MPKSIKNNLFLIQNSIHGNLAKINWVPKNNLHITLKFIGNINESKLFDIKNHLNEIKFEPFYLELGKIGFFKRNFDLGVIKVSFKKDNEIINLQRKVDESLLDIVTTDQKFNPHLTLGRIKLIKKEKEFLEKINIFKLSKERFLISEFGLIESKLTKDGSKYKIIETFKS